MANEVLERSALLEASDRLDPSEVLETNELDTRPPGLATELRDSLERALELGGRGVDRLGAAGTSVTFEVAGAESVTLLLDRRPPVVTGGDEPAEITVEFDADQAALFASGELVLPNAVLRGEVACSGPVRKYLALDPIVRALLGRANAPEEL
jgi:hypothetical protein